VERGAESTATSGAAPDLRAKLADVLWRSKRLEETREVLHEALGGTGLDQPLLAARLYARLGRVEMDDDHYEAALAAFDAADELLGGDPESQSDEWVDLWLEIQLDGRANLHTWHNEVARAGKVLERARPVVEARGSPTRKSGLYAQLAHYRARERRYQIDDEVIGMARRAVQAAEEGVDEQDMASVLFGLGFYLLGHDPSEAQAKLTASLAIAERTGDPHRQAMCLCCLCPLVLDRGDIEAVGSLPRRALAAATEAHYPQGEAAAKSFMARAAWVEGRTDDVVRLSADALDIWDKSGPSYAFQSVCLWPLLSVRLLSGQLPAALDVACRIADPSQARLRGELEPLLRRAKVSWDQGEKLLAAKMLTEALDLASKLGYV
jgi:tetratricopeptide (TPR) repeat protein